MAEEFRKARRGDNAGPFTQRPGSAGTHSNGPRTEGGKQAFVAKSSQRRDHLGPGLQRAPGRQRPGILEHARGAGRAIIGSINGHKIWTSNADIADWAFVLVRTEPDAAQAQRHSYLLVDLKTKGVTTQALACRHRRARISAS